MEKAEETRWRVLAGAGGAKVIVLQYMQNGFNVFMSNADGEGASVPEADVD